MPRRLTDEAVNVLLALLSGELKRGSAEETDGWRALSWCLNHWDEVDTGIKMLVINMIDPTTRAGCSARFVIEPNLPKGHDRRRIAEFVWRLLDRGWRKKRAYDAGADRFHVSISTIERACRQWHPIYERPGSRLKAIASVYNDQLPGDPSKPH